MTNPVSLRLITSQPGKLQREPIVSGIPFGKGKLFDIGSLRLTDEKDAVISAYFKDVAKWPDGSIKWVHVYFQAGGEGFQTKLLYIRGISDCETGNNPAWQNSGIKVETLKSKITVSTGTAAFDISTDDLGPFSQVSIDGIEQLNGYGSQIRIRDRNGTMLESRITDVNLGDELNPIQRTLVLSGGFYGHSDKLFAHYLLRLTFYMGLATVKVDFSVHNPQAAEHPDGKWDLGDKGSVFFSDLAEDICLSNTHGELSGYIKHELDDHWSSIGTRNFYLFQGSSGGNNWNSGNHVNAANENTVKFRGYKSIEDDVEIKHGLRACPIVRLNSSSVNICVYIKDFWQNFPKVVELESNKIRLKLFPDQFSDTFEMQGGEQKTHTFYLGFSKDPDSLNWCMSPYYVQLDSDYVSRTKSIGFLSNGYRGDELQILIDRGIDGASNFFDKREKIDEYGWRNFGDIYADHEELNYKGTTQLISHYNNQYDALDGFLRQYILSGDTRWFDLAAPLAQHVVDIDIYKTTEDRHEYNGGLFWHTDHYVNAYTCTHRTYTEKNTMSHDGTVGGGPGREHCYTTGLANFYFLTGDSFYKDAALGLVQWLDSSFEGSGTVLERILLFVSRDVSVIRKLISGKSVPKYDYIFTRETGNYLTALIDAYQLTDDPGYINRAESVIKHTIHPRDNILLRHLDEIEERWSYLVFLQAICKYLLVKASNTEIDQSFFYARDCLLHYAEWMRINESPFLDNTDKLDFPNLTWAAQDLRKAFVFYIASWFNTENKESFRIKSEYFKNYVVTELQNGENTYYARILIILMQNYLAEDLEIIEFHDSEASKRVEIDYGEPPQYSLQALLIGFAVDLLRRVRRFSPSREWSWLKYRLR